jgi:hypothetical protein
VPCTLFDRLTGLTATDALVALLMRLSGKPAPARLKRQRASWSTPCSTATSTWAASGSPSAPSPTCCSRWLR